MYHHHLDLNQRKFYQKRRGAASGWLTSICARCGDMTYQDAQDGTRCFHCGATVAVTVYCKDEAQVKAMIREANATDEYQHYTAERICVHYRLLGDVVYAERADAW